MKIFIRAFKHEGYHGDRARAMGSKPKIYYDYEVIMATNTGEITIHNFDGYDTRDSYLLPDKFSEANKYMNNVASALDLDVLDTQYMEKQSTVNWVRKSS